MRDQQPLVSYITFPQRNKCITASRYDTKSYALKALKMFNTQSSSEISTTEFITTNTNVQQ